MAGLYYNLALNVLLILKMQLICSLFKNLSSEIIRCLASLLLGKTRRQSYITIFCGKKIRKENSFNNLTTSILRAPNEKIVQNHLNIALLNVF